MADATAKNTFKRYGVRKRVWEQGANVKPTDLAEAVRDVDGELGKIYPRQIVEPTIQYNPPAAFTVACDHSPWGVVCIRIRLAQGRSDQLISNGGGQCSFAWKDGSLLIYGVGDLVLPNKYVFTLEIIG